MTATSEVAELLTDRSSQHNGRLLPDHLALLHASAISDQVIAARQAWTAKTGSELERLGYKRNTATPPALALPLWGIDGEPVGYQIRPDRPPVIDGRIAKYLSPPGSPVRLDIPPPCRELIGSPRVALWITEGIKKADALASAGVTAVGLTGVQMFRCDDWDRIPLDGRRVYVVFDSDVMVKRPVYDALRALNVYLSARGGLLEFVYLPTDHGKTGVDDYLAAGHTVEDLYRLAEPELRDPPAEPGPERNPAAPTATLLWYVEQLLRRFVRFPTDHEITALTLWTLHTWAVEAVQATPYMLIVSPEKRSGKTRVLEAVELVVREPLRAANITAAGVFQAIEKWMPTLLVDELDAVFGSKSEQAEALRSVLNAGNRRGDDVVRGTAEGEPQRFRTFCPKILSGINTGRLPDTIRDRAIVLAIERKRRNEQVQDLFPAELDQEVQQLRGWLADWAAENTEWLAPWRRSERIAELHDRAQEAWDCLLAISDLAGNDWPERARQAAIALAKGAADTGDETHGHTLLLALQVMFDTADPLTSKEICQVLNHDEELPFGGYADGTGIAPRSVSKLLRPYGIKPRNVRVGQDQAKGYHRDQFTEAWERYVPVGGAHRTDPSKQASHPSHRPTDPESSMSVGDLAGTDTGQLSVPRPSQIRPTLFGTPAGTDTDPAGTDSGTDENPRKHWDGTDGTDGTDKSGPPCAVRRSGIDYAALSAAVPAPERRLADLSDQELIAAFPGSWIEPPSNRNGAHHDPGRVVYRGQG